MKILLLFFCVFAVLPVACTPCDLDSAQKADAEKETLLRIVFGEGGGITGAWEGYTIAGDGVVYAWRGLGARENEHEVGRLPADTMCALWDAVKTLRAVPSVDSSGSLVRFLSVTMQDSTRKYSWRPELGANVPKFLYRDFHERCLAAIRNSMKPSK